MRKFVILLTLSAIIYLCCVTTRCATTQKTSDPAVENTEQPQIKMVEDFDPLLLTDDNFVIEPKFIDQNSGREARPVRIDSLITVHPDSEQVKIVLVKGYRVQICSFTNMEDANEIKREAMLNFEDLNIYSIFDPPRYKIRIGDFEQRRNAETFQDKAISLGFENAWIVPTLVEKIIKN